jgi:hypothetical protein
MNNKFELVWKEVGKGQLEALSQHFLQVLKKTTKNLSLDS